MYKYTAKFSLVGEDKVVFNEHEYTVVAIRFTSKNEPEYALVDADGNAAQWVKESELQAIPATAGSAE